MNRQDYNHEWLIRDDQINSYNELQAFIEETHLDQSDIYLPGWDIVPMSSLINVLKICDVLYGIKNQLEIKITSEVTLEDIRNNNIIRIL